MKLSDKRYNQLRNAGIWINERTGGEKGQPLCARLCKCSIEGSRAASILEKGMDAIHERILEEPTGHCLDSWINWLRNGAGQSNAKLGSPSNKG